VVFSVKLATVRACALLLLSDMGSAKIYFQPPFFSKAVTSIFRISLRVSALEK